LPSTSQNIVKHDLLTFAPTAIKTLSNRDRRMAQRFTDASNIDARFQQLDCKRVAVMPRAA
jgi:hypothetical protein